MKTKDINIRLKNLEELSRQTPEKNVFKLNNKIVNWK